MASFKAEAGKVYTNKMTGAQASFTEEQLKDPATGFLSGDFQALTTGQTPLSQTGMNQSPSQVADVSGQGVSNFGLNTPSSWNVSTPATRANQTSPSAEPKDIGTITSVTANQRVIDSRQAANTGLTQLEQDQSRIEMEQAQKAERERKRFNEEAALKQALSGVEATQLANQFAEQQRTRGAAEFKLGQTGTYYQENAGDKAKQEYEGQVYRLNLQDQILQSQIARAYENNNVTLAKELRERKDALVKNAQLAQDEAFNRMIKMTDLDSKLSKDADVAFEQIAKGGIELDSEDIKLLEEKYNLPQGMGEVKLRAYQKEAERQNIKDSNEARKADFDIASNITTMLSKIPMGQSIVIGGQEYMGLDRGNIKTGTETNSETGEVTFWEYNPLSGQTKTTSLGQIGTSRDGWETKFDDNGQPWRLNPTSGQMLPFYPTRAQQDVQAILPEGSVSPFLDKNGNPRTECGAFLNDCTGLGVGDSYQSKMDKMNLWTKGSDEPVESIIDKIQVGDGFTQKLNTWTGHVGMVLGVEKGPNGVMGIRAFESNYIPGKVTSTRFIPLSEIDGFGRGPTLHPLLKSGPDSQRNFASPTQSAGEPSVAPSLPSGQPTFGAKKTEQEKPLSLADLSEVNSRLPDDKKLAPGATMEDAARAGYVPGAQPKEPLKLDDKKRQLIAKSDEKKALDAGRDLAAALKDYRDLIADKGFEAFGTGKNRLESAYAALKIKYKEAANLGALTGPDVAIIEEAIKPATGFAGIAAKFTSGGNEGIIAGIDDAARALQGGMLRKYDALTSQYDEYANDSYLKSLGKGIVIRVRDKTSGQTGSLPAEEFDPSKFERL